MAPAPVAGAAAGVRTQVRAPEWTRETIIEAIREWVACYGEPPRAADWNPSAARWASQEWRVERYRAGRADGTPWPALNTAKRRFGGSLTAAIEAAGYQSGRPATAAEVTVDGPAREPHASAAVVETALARAADAEARAHELETELEAVRAAVADRPTKTGPAGPGVLAAELREVARIRATSSGGHDLRVALGRVAAAATAWRDCL